MNGVQPCDFTSSPVSSYIFMLTQPAAPLCATARARPQRVVGVEAELHVMGREAGVDHLELFGLRIVHRDLAARRGRSGTPSRTDGRSPPCRSPDWPPDESWRQTRPAPSRRSRGCAGSSARPRSSRRRNTARPRTSALPTLRRRLRVAHRQLHLEGDVLHRIEHRHHVGRVLGRAEDQAVGVDGRVALVAHRRVMQVGLRVRPVPHRDDGVALDALRPLRLGGRQFAGGDAVGPVAEHASTRACVPMRSMLLTIWVEAWPDWMRRVQASWPFANLPSAAGIVARRLVAELVAGRRSRWS